jgi:hypothetical protein
MNTHTTSRIDTDRTRALLERLDPSWREPCTVQGCAHHHCDSGAAGPPNTLSSPARWIQHRRSHSKWWL